MNLISASAASFSPTNALQRTWPVRLLTRTVTASRSNWSPGITGVAHLHLIHAQQHRKLAGVFQLLAQQDAAQLGQGLDDQHAGHDRGARVMALEENIVKGDVFDADRLVIALDFQHPIHQQHRIAVGQNALDPADIQCGVAMHQRLPGGAGLFFQQSPGQQMIQLMPALVPTTGPAAAGRPGTDRRSDPALCAGHIHRGNGIIVDRPVGVDHQQILRRQMLAHPAGLGFLGFGSNEKVRAGASWLTKSSAPTWK